MQKRVVYNFNAQTATGSAAKNSTGKAVKASNAISKIKRAFSGKSIKLAVLVVLLFVSLFCTIGSADWIISQQKNVPNSQDGSANATFKFDDLGLNNHIDIPNVAFSGNPAQANFKTTAPNSGRDLPAEAVSKQSIKYKVKPYNQTSAQSRVFRAPKNAAASTAKNMTPAAYANETLPDVRFFDDIEETTQLPTDAGTYAVLIISKVGKVSYGKAIKVFTIAPCPVRIVWSGNQNFTYDGTAHPITATAYKADENGPAIAENILSISLTYKAHGAADSTAATTVSEVKNAGTYTAIATITNNKNYAISSSEKATATTTFTVEQKALTVTADNKTVTYGESEPAYTFSCDGLVSTDSAASLGTPKFSCSYSTTSTVEGSPYEIKVSGLENLNYNINYVSGKLTVNKRALTLNWGTTSFVYDGEAHTPTPTANNVVNNDNLELTVTITGENITGSPASAINVGTYTATAAITNNNYVITAGNQITFTITARELTLDWGETSFVYNGEAQTPNPTANNVVTGDDLGLTVTITDKTGSPASAINVGTYTAEAAITNNNYVIAADNKTTFTITARALTVKATDNKITYGDSPSANGYTISGFVGTDNESIVTGLDSITYTFTYKQYDNIYNGTTLIDYYIVPVVSGLSAKNYSFETANGKLTVNKLPLTFADNAVISRKYTKNGIPFTADLFNAANDYINGTPCYFKSTGATLPNNILNNIYKNVSTATSAKNFSGDEDTTKPENGFYSYTFGLQIKAGSTYLISGVQLNDSSNFYLKLGSNSIYLKYCTAKVGEEFFTIEDALAKNGNITLCGDANDASTYVITAFAKFKNLSGTAFENYSNLTAENVYKYTLKSGTTLSLPYNDTGDTLNSTFDTDQSSSDFVYSALVISSSISFTIETTSTLNIGANVYTPKSGTLVSDIQTRSVVYNNGIINVDGKINCNGFLKGNGQSDNEKKSVVFLNKTGFIYDWMRPYNYGGGGRTKALHDKKVFPFEAYSLHNNSCNTVIVSGAQYICNLRLYPTTKVEAKINIVGNSNALFKIQSNHIIKSTTATTNALTTITGDNQIKGQRDIVTIHGTCYDSQLKVDAGVSISTSTDYPLPIGFMDIVICSDGNLTFQSSSYKFMPSSSLTIEAGGILNVTNNVSLTFYDNELCRENEARGQKQKFGVYTAPAKLIVKGTAVFSDSAAVSGLIEAGKNATLTLVNTQTLLKVPLSFSGQLLWTSVEIEEQHPSAVGVQTDSGAATTLNSGSYISTQGQDGNYYWIISDQLKTITFESDSAVLKTFSVILEKNNNTLIPYTIKTEDLPNEPTKEHYTFDGWYIGDSKLVPGTTTITDNTVFTARWTPKKYNIEYIHIGCTNEQLATITSDNPTQYTYNEKLVLNTPTSTSPELNFMGWFSNEGCTAQITEIAIGTHGNITIYGKWTTEQLKNYTITYESGLDEVSLNITTAQSTGFASGFTYEIPAINATWDGKTATLSPDFMNSTDLNTLVEERHYNFSKYFAGWYVYSASDGKTLLDTIYETRPTIEKAEDVILIPIWKNKAVLQVSFANSKGSSFVNGNNTFGQKTKYFTPGCSINNIIITAVCNKFATDISTLMGKQYQFTKYSTAQGDNADIDFPSDDGAIVDITALYTRYYYINISGNNISVSGNNPYTVEPTTSSFKISDKVTLSEGYEIKNYTINGVNSNSDTINLRNYDPYNDINVVVNTQLKQYTIRYDKGNYPSGKLTVTCNGQTVQFGSSITCHYNDKVKITTSSQWGAIITNADTNTQIGAFGDRFSSKTKEYSVTSNIIITQTQDDSVCIAAGTLISLYDGTKKKVEDLTSDDWILTFNHETGKLDKAKLLTNAHSGTDWKYYSVINLKFSNNSTVKVIREHGFFDLTLNKYVYINETNYNQYIGHKFYSTQWDGNIYSKKEITLDAAFIATEYTTIFSPVTEYALNIFTEEVLSVTTEIGNIANVFSFDENMKYDENEMNLAIDKYGLTNYEDLKDIVSFELYEKLPLKYYNIYIGKGLITKEQIQEVIQKYLTQ